MKKVLTLLAVLVTLFCFRQANAQGTYTHIAGNGTYTIPNTSGAALSSGIGSTTNVAVDRKGNVYFSDYTNHIISKVDTFGNITRVIGDPAVPGGDGDGGPATAAHVWGVEGIACDAIGNLYFAENAFGSSIRMVDTADSVYNVYYGGDLITNVFSDAAGNIYFTDLYNVKKIPSGGGSAVIVAGNSTAGFSGDGGPATAAQLGFVWDATVDNFGNIYIVDGDNNRIRKVDASGIITTIAGNGSTTISGDGGLAIYAGIGSSYNIDLDALGNIYLTGGANRMINPAGIISSPSFLSGVIDIAIDAAGNFYMPNGYIDKYTPAYTAVTTSHYLNINHTCGGPNLVITAMSYDASSYVINNYGDGRSDTTAFATGSFGAAAYTISNHTYTLAGSYTIKSVIYNASGAIDSFTNSYMHLPCGVIHLQSYVDGNSNCTYDATTDVASSLPISVAVDSNGVTMDTISMTAGMYYTAYGTAGDVYTFRVIDHPAGLVPSCPSSGIVADTFTIYGDNSRTIDLGFNCSAVSGFDLNINAAHRSGRHTQSISIVAGNNYCTPTSGTLTVNFNSRFNISSVSPTPTSVSGSTATWNLGALSTSNAASVINLTLEVASTWFTPGDTIHTDCIITPLSGDMDTSNNVLHIVDTVRGSYDPNYISVRPEGNILSGTKLHYAIEFENYGNDTAHNVYVMDTLSDNVDMSSFEMVTSTATMNISTFVSGGHNIVKFDFPNINLLDSSHHGQSTGTFMFNINAKRGLTDNTPIMNRVGIYFDDNEVVMTNEVYDIIRTPSISIASMGTVCPGDVMGFIATTPGIAGTEYRWQVNGAAAGTNSDTLRITTLSAGDVVRCLLWDGTGDTLLATSGNIVVSFGSAPSAGTLSGPANVCVGSTITITPSVSGGSWSGGGSFATVSGGVVTGTAIGTAVITYTVANSCGSNFVTHNVTVGTTGSAGTISGPSTVCTGSTITLTDATTGGTWSSTAAGIATVSTSGVVTGVTTGSATISYSITGLCGTVAATQTVTVTTTPTAGTVSGPSSVCAGATVTFTSSTTGGSWSSANPSIATVSTGGIVTGVAVGTTVISYTETNGCGSASGTASITVNTTPTLASITGPTSVCPSSTISLSDATAGGTWSSSASSIASISSSTGTVTGVTSGSAVMTYTLAGTCGTAAAIYTITVLPAPSAGTITGSTGVCPGATTTLSNAISGGTWTSSSSAAATVSAGGVVTGITSGTVVISYAVTSTCGTAVATYTLTINNLPVAGSITGAATVCEEANVTMSDTVSGGLWSSSAPAVATVNPSTGVVTGVLAGTANIIYAVTNSCGTASAARAITVNPLPVVGTITGSDSVCVGATVTLADAVSGGVWSSGSTSVASVSTSGVVRGVSAGAAIISYTRNNSCGYRSATYTVNVISGGPCPSGIDNLQMELAGMLVYPNPTEGIFTIELPATEGNATITIIDVLGRTVQERDVENRQGSKTTFNLNEVAAGNYLIKVTSGNQTFKEKIVIR